MHENLAETLSEHVPKGHADDGIHAGFGDEQQRNVHRCQPYRGIDPDLPEALIYGTHHRIQDNQRRNEHRYNQRLHPLDRRNPEGSVGGHGNLVPVTKTREQRARNAYEIVFDQRLNRRLRIQFDTDGTQIAENDLQGLVRHDQHVFRRQMHEGPHVGKDLILHNDHRGPRTRTPTRTESVCR